MQIVQCSCGSQRVKGRERQGIKSKRVVAVDWVCLDCGNKCRVGASELSVVRHENKERRRRMSNENSSVSWADVDAELKAGNVSDGEGGFLPPMSLDDFLFRNGRITEEEYLERIKLSKCRQ